MKVNTLIFLKKIQILKRTEKKERQRSQTNISLSIIKAMRGILKISNWWLLFM